METQRRNHSGMAGWVHLWHNQAPQPWGWQPTSWRTTKSQRPSCRSGGPKFHATLPSSGFQHWEDEKQGHLALKASGLNSRSSAGLGETETPFSWEAHTESPTHQAQGQRQPPHRNLGQTHPVIPKVLLGGQGQCGQPRGHKSWWQTLQECPSTWALLEAPI